MNNKLTIDMPANYSFTVLDGSESLTYESDYQIYDDPPCEALTMGITRDLDLEFLDHYYGMLGGLKHFVRVGHNEA